MKRWLVLALVGVACASDPAPAIDGVSPDHWREPFPPGQIRISGEHLHGSLRVNLKQGGGVRTPTAFSGELGGEPLAEVVWESNLELSAVPPRLPAGSHQLVIRTPSGVEAVLDDAVTVLPVGIGAAEGGDGGTLPVVPGSDGSCDTGAPIEYRVTVDPPVDPLRSVLFYNYAVDSWQPQTGALSAMLDSTGSEVVFARGADAGAGIDLSWSVVQIAGADVQRGEMPHGGIVTLDRPVSADRSFALASWRACGCDFDGLDWALARLLCDQGTCAELDVVYTSGDQSYSTWQVIELEAGTGAEVMSGELTLTLADATMPVTLPHGVDPTASFLVFTQTIRSDTDFEYVASYGIAGELTPDGTGLTFAREVAAIPEIDRNTIDVAWFVVSWPYFAVQRGPIDLGVGELAVDIPLQHPVDPSAAFTLLPGSLRQGSSPYVGPDTIAPLPGCSRNDHVGEIWFQTSLSDDGTTLTVRRASAQAPAHGSWNVVEVL